MKFAVDGNGRWENGVRVRIKFEGKTGLSLLYRQSFPISLPRLVSAFEVNPFGTLKILSETAEYHENGKFLTVALEKSLGFELTIIDASPLYDFF